MIWQLTLFKVKVKQSTLLHCVVNCKMDDIISKSASQDSSTFGLGREVFRLSLCVAGGHVTSLGTAGVCGQLHQTAARG